MRFLLPAAALGLLISGCASTDPVDHWTTWPPCVPAMKVSRGLANIVLSPFDVPATVVRVTRDTNDPAYGLLAGLPEGAVNACVRVVAGVVEILTFPLVYDAEPFYQRTLGTRCVPKSRDPDP